MRDETHKQFESLSRQVADARAKCEMAYFAWTRLAHELKLLERQQSEIFGKMVAGSVTDALPETNKPL